MIGPTGFLSICQMAIPNTAAYRYDNQTRGTLDWVVMSRSFGNLEFRNFKKPEFLLNRKLRLQATNFADKFGQSVRKLLNQSCLCQIGFKTSVLSPFFTHKTEHYHNFDPGALLWLLTRMLIW